MKLAIIDLDGVVADATARFARAELERSLYLAGTDRPERLQREATDVYWRTALDPAYVHLDTLIDGANDQLNRLIDEGCKLIFLTSRPQAMTAATLEWCGEHLFIKAGSDIVFKAPGFQYVKTVVWKIGMIQTLMAMHLAGNDEVLIVDDESAHWYQAENVKCYASLKAVFEPEKPIEGVEDPFLPDE